MDDLITNDALILAERDIRRLEKNLTAANDRLKRHLGMMKRLQKRVRRLELASPPEI